MKENENNVEIVIPNFQRNRENEKNRNYRSKRTGKGIEKKEGKIRRKIHCLSTILLTKSPEVLRVSSSSFENGTTYQIRDCQVE